MAAALANEGVSELGSESRAEIIPHAPRRGSVPHANANAELSAESSRPRRSSISALAPSEASTNSNSNSRVTSTRRNSTADAVLDNYTEDKVNQREEKGRRGSVASSLSVSVGASTRFPARRGSVSEARGETTNIFEHGEIHVSEATVTKSHDDDVADLFAQLEELSQPVESESSIESAVSTKRAKKKCSAKSKSDRMTQGARVSEAAAGKPAAKKKRKLSRKPAADATADADENSYDFDLTSRAVAVNKTTAPLEEKNPNKTASAVVKTAHVIFWRQTTYL
jgi:hypothetical protein